MDMAPIIYVWMQELRSQTSTRPKVRVCQRFLSRVLTGYRGRKNNVRLWFSWSTVKLQGTRFVVVGNNFPCCVLCADLLCNAEAVSAMIASVPPRATWSRQPFRQST